MKITSVLFENFIAIETGMGLRKLKINLSDFKNMIVLLVGPMGSGKTTILSHLIPYAHVGTLDERNSNPIIISGEDGRKEIVYEDDENVYKIVHKYTWTKDHHAIKSYIEKNGEELNPNGNQNSFKEFVEVELGFNADLTRLLRLGPNVANVIDMSTIERKEFIAKRQENVELYLSIHKDMKDRAHGLSAQSQLLARKLNGITEADVDDIREHNKSLSKKIAAVEDKLNHLNADLSALNTENDIYLEGKGIRNYEDRMEYLETQLTVYKERLTHKRCEVETLTSNYGSITDVLREIGRAEADIENNNQIIISLNLDIQQFDKKRLELASALQTIANDAYIRQLQDEYVRYNTEIEELRNAVIDFECDYNSGEINSMIGQIRVMDIELNSLITDNPNVVMALLKGNSSMVPNARVQIDKLQGRIIKLQREMSNIKFVDNYDVSDELSLPSGCKDFTICPYFYTHPNTVKKDSKKGSLVSQMAKIQDEIDALNARIDELSSYPAVWARLEQCRKTFNAIAPMLKKIGALVTPSVDKILSKNTARVWYDNDVIIDTLEKCVKREKLTICELKVIELKSSLDKSLSVDVDKLQADYKEVLDHIQSNKDTIKKVEESNKSIVEFQKRLNKSFDNLKNINVLRDEIRQCEEDIKNTSNGLAVLRDRYGIVLKNQEAIESLEDTISIVKGEHNALNAELTASIIKLNTIVDYQREYADIAAELKILNLIIKASSPKNGIPLIYVQTFLNDCVDDINDMLANVLPDVEVCEFVINEKEFRIPYAKGGRIIEDVVSASQGERAIISIALSFALMMKSSSKYNIPLLDEVDGPIHNVSRRSLLLIFSQYFKKINAEQAFFITHNDIFEGYPVDIISTSTDEHLVNKHGKVLNLT